MADKRLTDPRDYFDDIPAYMIPLFQSQARQEVMTEQLDEALSDLQMEVDSKPCVQHSENIARMDERLKTLEDTRKGVIEQQRAENAVLITLRKHPWLTKGGIGGLVLTAIIAALKAGVLERIITGGI